MLLDMPIRVVPASICAGEPNEKLAEWAREENVRFFLYRPPVSPWRLWHFRVPWLQEKLTGTKPANNPYWVLYELRDGVFARVDPPAIRNWPRQVPGM